MEIRYPPESEAFRQRLRAWLDEHLPADWRFGGAIPRDEESWARRQLEWDRRLYAGGWMGLAWPREYGGGGASLIEQVVFEEEIARAGAPEGMNLVGVRLLGPTLIQWGTKAQKRRFLPPILAGQEIWCQGFSEPNAGSDLAAVMTRAERHGDRYVVTGQKVWTSRAQWAHWMFALVRTEPQAPKHRGLTFLLIDMTSQGITVRPLRQLTGSAEFSEVFFDAVEVPVENVVGQPGEGWKVAMATLGHERGPMITARAIRCQAELEHIIALARDEASGGRAPLTDPAVRRQLAEIYAETMILRWNAQRVLTQMLKGNEPGAPGVYGKLFWSEVHQRMARLAMDVQGAHSQLDVSHPAASAGGYWQYTFLRSLAATIYAGTSEIQRNIVAERVLGLPR